MSSHASEPGFRELDRHAALAKQGSEASIRTLTTYLFKQAGVRPEIADAFSFNKRVVQAEISYRKGAHLPVTAKDRTMASAG